MILSTALTSECPTFTSRNTQGTLQAIEAVSSDPPLWSAARGTSHRVAFAGVDGILGEPGADRVGLREEDEEDEVEDGHDGDGRHQNPGEGAVPYRTESVQKGGRFASKDPSSPSPKLGKALSPCAVGHSRCFVDWSKNPRNSSCKCNENEYESACGLTAVMIQCFSVLGTDVMT